MWVRPHGGEGAKQWLNMLTELRNRGILEACIGCCGGLKGLPDAITATWPQASVQTSALHARDGEEALWSRRHREMTYADALPSRPTRRSVAPDAAGSVVASGVALRAPR